MLLRFKLTLMVYLISVFLIGIISNPVFSQAARQNDASVVAVQELNDIEGNEWAYKAVQELVEKYDVLEGYPDGTYKGQKSTTRFELAAAVYDLATYFSDEISGDREDLSKLAKLMEEFSGEIKALQQKVDEMEKKVASIDTRTTALEGQIAEQRTKIEEHEKRLAYAERRKGFILERLLKGLVVDIRDLSRGIIAAVSAPFDKNISASISKQ